MKLGTVLIWLGIGIAIAGLLLLVYQVMTCGCEDSVDEEGILCVCPLAPYILMIIIGTIIAAVGFAMRYRHRRKTLSNTARDAD